MFKRIAAVFVAASIVAEATALTNQSDQAFCMFDNKPYQIGAVIKASDGYYTCKLISISNARNEAPVWVRIGKRLEPLVTF